MTSPKDAPECRYCGRPAKPSGACGSHEDLLALEPEALAREVDAIAELEEELVREPGDRRRRRKRRPPELRGERRAAMMPVRKSLEEGESPVDLTAKFDEERDVYEYGITVDDVFVPIGNVAGTSVRARVSDAQNPDRQQFPQKD